MFDLLKKKLSSFTDKLKKKTEEPVQQEQAFEQKPIQEPSFQPKPVSKPEPVHSPGSEKIPRLIQEKMKKYEEEPEFERETITRREPQPVSKPIIVPEPKPIPVKQEPKPVQSIPRPVQELVQQKQVQATIKETKKEIEIPPIQKPWPSPEEKEAEKSNPDVSDLLRSSISSVRDELVKEHELEKKPVPQAKPVIQPVEPQETPQVDMKKVEQVKEKVAVPVKPAQEAKPMPEPAAEPKPKKPEDFKLKSFSEFLGGKPPEQQVIEEKPVSLEEQEAGLKRLSEQLNAIKADEEKFKPVQESVSREELLRERLKPKVDKRELKSTVGAFGLLKGALKGHVELKESDISELLFELELSLLEADVNQETAKALIAKIKEHLLKEKIPRGEAIDKFLKEKIKQSLAELTHTEQINLLNEINAKQEKPFRILFIGPNGAGKTTTIAKLSFALRSLGKSVIWAASDTFRAASIEQLEEHARKLNIRVVKHSYGADPTAVAFDAVKAAQASNIEVVIIDSAGRQETNRNLIEELKKLERVIKPDLKIFVGETYSGKGLIDMARSFDEAIGIDGFILTKIDADPKGGTVISLLYELKKPVLFIGTGQRYEDLTPFTPSFIIDRII